MRTRSAFFAALVVFTPVGAQEVSITPDRLKWSQSVASPSETTLLMGDPRQPGPWVSRARLKPGMKTMPHSHPLDIHVTVLSGTLLYAEGDSFDETKLREYPAGSFLIERANVPHYAMPKDRNGVVFQASGTGANAFTYVNRVHDPRIVREELAPNGRLRVGLIMTNPAFVVADGTPADMRGVAVELGHGLAQQLRVEFVPVRFHSAMKLLDGAKAGEWDIAFIGIEPGRTADMDFSAAYLEVGTTYLVPGGSKIRTVADADQPGHRIIVSERSVQDIFLTRNLKRAELLRVATVAPVTSELLSGGKAHALAGSRPLLIALSEKIPGSRVVDDNFSITQHGLAVPKGRPAALAYASQYIEQAKAGGLVQEAVERNGLRGVNVAPRVPSL